MQNEKDTHKCTFFKKIYITMLNYPYICIQNVRQRMKLYGQSRDTPWQITYLYIYIRCMKLYGQSRGTPWQKRKSEQIQTNSKK